MTKVIDISLPIRSGMPIFPGTLETNIKSVKSSSGRSTLSEITMTSHAGTHIDAPNHVASNQEGIDSIPLHTFYGRCRVLDMTTSESVITEEDIRAHKIRSGERLLLKTKNSLRGFDMFYEDYVYLDGNAAQYLADCGISLIGFDALSINKRGSDDNLVHLALLAQTIPIIEGLNLSEVDKGEYTLCAFPLAFQGIDGSPTRAVLLSSS